MPGTYLQRTCPTVWMPTVLPKKDGKIHAHMTIKLPRKTGLNPKRLRRIPFKKAPTRAPAWEPALRPDCQCAATW